LMRAFLVLDTRAISSMYALSCTVIPCLTLPHVALFRCSALAQVQVTTLDTSREQPSPLTLRAIVKSATWNLKNFCCLIMPQATWII
jgi:hypothetical protein